ncbi:hypothetical protein [Desulforhopalus sp. 52FAK]
MQLTESETQDRSPSLCNNSIPIINIDEGGATNRLVDCFHHADEIKIEQIPQVMAGLVE